MSSTATKRLAKEYKAFQVENPPLMTAKPSETDILKWHYVLTGPEDTPYSKGQYYGTLTFPKEYPFKAPAIRMITPSGRFDPGQRICLTMSDYHPESWNPAWNVTSILQGLQSFMVSKENATGCISCTDSQIVSYSKASKRWNSENADFQIMFPELYL